MVMQNESMEGRNVNNIVGAQLMTRDNIYMLLVEYKYRRRGGVHDEYREVDSGYSLIFKLTYLTDDMSPKLRKPRRKKVQAKLKQATLNVKSQVNEHNFFS